MPRYIDLEKFERRIKKYVKPEIPEEKAFVKRYTDECIRQGYAMPTADVQEVRHGRWIGYPSITISKRRRTVQSIIYKCSCCGKSNGRAKSPYCKNCGSKMYGEEAEAKIKELEGEK